LLSLAAEKNDDAEKKAVAAEKHDDTLGNSLKCVQILFYAVATIITILSVYHPTCSSNSG
jgi:hypothetical protein